MDSVVNITMNATNHTNDVWCGQGVDKFYTSYLPIHGYVSLLVCILGSIANVLNIIVLTRKEMHSPTNAILTGLAIADLLVMIDYIPFALIRYIMPHLNYPRYILFSYNWVCFILFHAVFTQICHTISIWLTVTLAVWRYIAVAFPQRNRFWCNMKTTLYTIASSYIICPLIVALPFLLMYSIRPATELIDDNGNQIKVNLTNGTSVHSIGRNVTLYFLKHSDFAESNLDILNVHLIIFGSLIKLVPCIALTILSQRLIAALIDAKRRRKQLITNNAIEMSTTNGKIDERPRKNSKTLEKERQTDRTTRMLLAVLLLFLITEFPQGILVLLSAILGESFHLECYQKLGEVMDILALINSGINFILYCTMSRQFRNTFSILFKPKFLTRWVPVAQTNDDEHQYGVTDFGRDNNGQMTQITQV